MQKLTSDTKQAFEEVKTREEKNLQTVRGELQVMKNDIDASVQQAIATQSKQLDSTLQDLRSLLLRQTQKRKPEVEDMEP